MLDDEERALLQHAFADVQPLKSDKIRRHKRNLVPTKKQPVRFEVGPAPIYLSDHYYPAVQGDDILSYCSPSLPIARLRALRHGDIPIEKVLDLHGCTSSGAKTQFLAALHDCRLAQVRCLLLIHGKGGMEHTHPVLKNLVNHWLRQLPDILGFHSAKPQHGGTGALYVLLKKQHDSKE